MNKCYLNLNRKPSGGETDHRKAAKSSLVTMLSGPVVIISGAAARATAVIIIGPTATVVDTVFFVIDQPITGLVGIGQYCGSPGCAIKTVIGLYLGAG